MEEVQLHNSNLRYKSHEYRMKSQGKWQQLPMCLCLTLKMSSRGLSRKARICKTPQYASSAEIGKYLYVI